MKTTLIIPTLNEIDGMKAIMPSLKKDWYDQLIILDGGSTDGTIEYAKEQDYFVYVQKKTGFRHAYTEVLPYITGDVVLTFSPDGNSIPDLIPELIEMGLDVLNPFQPEVMDVYEIKRKYGHCLSFYGGIGTQKLLPHGTVHEVETDVRNKIHLLGKNGGYLLAPAHAVQADVPVENILKLIEGMQSQESVK